MKKKSQIRKIDVEFPSFLLITKDNYVNSLIKQNERKKTKLKF